MKLAVIVAAYQAQKYIEDMLVSFREQYPVEGWEYEMRIGVDGCPETAAELDRLGVPYWISETNVGAYVMRNSLILTGYADIYAIFDADDVMNPDYLRSSIGNMGTSELSIIGGQQCNKELVPTSAPTMIAIMSFTHAVWEKAGGFRPERIGSDTDFQLRCNAMGISHNLIRTFGFKRRNHEHSLTHSKETGQGSHERARIIGLHKKLRTDRSKTVKPEVVELRYVQ